MGAAALAVNQWGRRALALLLVAAAAATAAVLALGPRAGAVPASATAPGVAGVTPGTGGETWFEGLSASEQASWISTMVADGVKWLRIDSPGSLAGWYDTEIQDAENAGIDVDALIETWGMSSVTASTMGPMCTGQVNQLEPLGVQTYEVINEPNLNGYSAADYESLLAACYTAIKAADASATVLVGGLGPGGGSEEPATYLAAIYAAGGEPYFDAMNMHPYDYDSAMDQTPTTAADCPGNDWNPWENCDYAADISDVRSVMDANGDSSKAIWLTEFGCPTGTDGGYAADCDDSQLATQITDAFDQIQANPGDEYGLLGPLFVYDLIDTNSSDDPSGSGYDDFGLYTDTGVAKTGVVSAFEAGAALADPTSSTTTTTPSVAPAVVAVEPNSGPMAGGASVEISGTGFSGATAVDFGATAAQSFTVVSSTEITAVSPPGAGVVNVTVTDADGASATSAADRYGYIES